MCACWLCCVNLLYFVKLSLDGTAVATIIRTASCDDAGRIIAAMQDLPQNRKLPRPTQGFGADGPGSTMHTP